MIKRTFILMFVILTLNSCSSRDTITELSESRWVVTAISGKTVTSNETSKGLPSINFGENGKLFGSTGCNNYTGFFKLKNNSVSFNPNAMTKIMCPGNVEQNFLIAIRQVTNYKIDGDKLDLLNGSKTVISLVKTEK
jgi:heat shock protein HslJ